MLRLFSHIILSVGFFAASPLFSQVTETTEPLLYDRSQSTIKSRFTPPEGYHWLTPERGSFSEYIINFPLHPPGFPVRDYRAVPIAKQKYHIAVLKIDVGDKDLQQCADAWMRLYAEYLWSKGRAEEVVFQFTSGQLFRWTDYRKGLRTQETGRRVRFYETNSYDDSYPSFRAYLSLIFRYAGTISLDRESAPVLQNSDIRPGDFLIKPGSPGHSVIIVGVAVNRAGKRLFLLAESFMPAQDIHILHNMLNTKLSPWHELDLAAPETATAKYVFKPTSVKRFHALAQ